MADSTAGKPTRRFKRPALFICDIQEKFRTAIWNYDKVILTTQKMISFFTLLNIPIYATTQLSSKLGPLIPELSLPPTTIQSDKTKFSMWIPSIASHFPSSDPPSEIVIVGIEAHICVTQTALDAVKAGHKVYVLVDGVSSCNKEEVGVALERLRREGVTVCSSESWIFECVGDAGMGEFKQVAGLVKEWSGRTKEVMGGLVSKI